MHFYDNEEKVSATSIQELLFFNYNPFSALCCALEPSATFYDYCEVRNKNLMANAISHFSCRSQNKNTTMKAAST
jgi:hypothetical protein